MHGWKGPAARGGHIMSPWGLCSTLAPHSSPWCPALEPSYLKLSLKVLQSPVHVWVKSILYPGGQKERMRWIPRCFWMVPKSWQRTRDHLLCLLVSRTHMCVCARLVCVGLSYNRVILPLCPRSRAAWGERTPRTTWLERRPRRPWPSRPSGDAGIQR